MGILLWVYHSQRGRYISAWNMASLEEALQHEEQLPIVQIQARTTDRLRRIMSRREVDLPTMLGDGGLGLGP